jgi:hypothetical protein
MERSRLEKSGQSFGAAIAKEKCDYIYRGNQSFMVAYGDFIKGVLKSTLSRSLSLYALTLFGALKEKAERKRSTQ